MKANGRPAMPYPILREGTSEAVVGNRVTQRTFCGEGEFRIMTKSSRHPMPIGRSPNCSTILSKYLPRPDPLTIIRARPHVTNSRTAFHPRDLYKYLLIAFYRL